MKTIKITFLAVCSVILFASCEKTIDLDLDESAQKIVIEAIVHDSLGDNYVILSKTRAYNNNSAQEMISGANIQVVDNQNNTNVLYEISPGIYTDSTLQGIANRTYTLAVTVDGETFTASSYMYPRVEIDSLSQEQIEEAFWEDEGIPEYTVRCHFTDPANTENFYRIKAFLAGEQEDGFLALEDEFFDGLSTYFPVFESNFFEGDSVTIQLLSIDEVNYRYFTAISASQDGQVPGNPISNINSENAVGYFGVYAKSEKNTIIVPE